MVFPLNTHVAAPVYSIHHDKRYYENPEKFDPERFTEENRARRIPYTYIPFGTGPRICIGECRKSILWISIKIIFVAIKYKN